MGKTLNKGLLGVSLALLLFLGASTAMAIESVPSLPMCVDGVALIDGKVAPNGTVVAACMDGKPVAESKLNSTSGNFFLLIEGDSEKDKGKIVTFTVKNVVAAPNYSWESGKQISSLELSVKSEAGKSSGSGSGLGSGSTSKTTAGTGTQNFSSPAVEEKGGTVPEPNLTDLEGPRNEKLSLTENKSTAPEDQKRTPAFGFISAVAGILLLYLGSAWKDSFGKE